MNSIINPWVFYWISVSDAMQRLMWCGVAIGLIVLIVSACYDEDGTPVCGKHKNKVRKIGIVIASLCLIGAVFIPSEDTCYKMLAANMFTQDNINSATDYVTDVIDYAVDKVKELNPADSTKE